VTELDVAGGFSVHEYRHGLTLIEEDRATIHVENREGFACPACGEPFEELFVSERRDNTWESGNADVSRPPGGKLLLLTHPVTS